MVATTAANGTVYLVGEIPSNYVRLHPDWVRLARILILNHAELSACMGFPNLKHNPNKKLPAINILRDYFDLQDIGLAYAKHSYECALEQLVQENKIRP